MAKQTFIGSTAEAIERGTAVVGLTADTVLSALDTVSDAGFQGFKELGDFLSGVPMSNMGDKLWHCGISAIRKTAHAAQRIIHEVVRRTR